MKLLVSLGCALLISTPALAADFSLDGTYGTAAGCALSQKAQSVPSGKAYAVSAKTMLNGDATCTVLGASDPTTDASGTTWQVNVSCEAGDEVAEKGVVQIALSTDKASLVAKVVDGVGPTGSMKLCKAAQ